MFSPSLSICRSLEELYLMKVPHSMFTKGLPFPSKIIYCIVTWCCKTTEF